MKARIAAVVGASALVAWVGLAPAQATSSQAVRFTLQRDSNTVEDGWRVQGAIVDGGDWDTTFFAFGAGGPATEVEVKTTQHGAAGDIYLDFQGHRNTTRSGTFGGTWQVLGGTGAYAHLAGGGTWTRSGTPGVTELTFDAPGSVHFD